MGLGRRLYSKGGRKYNNTMTTKTRDAVKYMRRWEPTIRATKMARMLGVTKARIRAILVDENLPTKVIAKEVFQCIVCSTILDKNINFCSDECHQKHFYLTTGCLQCGSPITMYRRQYVRKAEEGERTFCSIPCKHQWYWDNEPTRMGRWN